MNKTDSILYFDNYRTFLLAHGQRMKDQKPSWSYGMWARQLGLKGTSSLTKIIGGERNPGAKIEQGLVKYFKFNKKEAQYFSDLIQLQKLHSNARLSALLKKNLTSKAAKSSKTISYEAFSLISNWYYYTIREMTQLKDFSDDPTWIAKRLNFKVTETEIKKAIHTLLKLKLLERNESGQLKVADNRVETGHDVSSVGLRRFHSQMLEHAKTALEKIPVLEREISSDVLVIDSKDLPRAKEEIRKFREQFIKEFECKSGDQVFQLQQQLFPMTNNGAKK